MFQFQFNSEKDNGCTYEEYQSEKYENTICAQVFANQLSKYITHRLDLAVREFPTPYLHFGKQEYIIGLLLLERRRYQ